MSNVTTSTTIRYHGLDALRAFAMITGIILHAALLYTDDDLAYEITGKKGTPTSDTLGMVFFFIHTWRMPVFFLLAGFFTRLMVQRRGLVNLLKNRSIRIGIPLIIGSLTYNLLLGFGTITQLHHLWFLYDLVWMYLILCFIKYLGIAPKWFWIIIWWPLAFPAINRRISTLLRKYTSDNITQTFDSIFSSYGNLWYLMIFLIPATTVGRPLFINWINTDIGIPGPFFITGFSYFLVGWFMHRNTEILSILSNNYKKNLILAAGSFFVFITVLGLADGNKETEEVGLYHLIGLVLSPITTFLLVIAFIGIADLLFQRSNTIITYFVDASYWIYLFHLVAVFAIGSAIITEVQPIVGVSINIIFTTVICICTYHIFARYTPIGWTLHGKKWVKKG